MPTAFLIHWNRVEAAEKVAALEVEGWEVRAEWESGAAAYRAIKESPPQVVIIYLSRLPSPGRETADALKRAKATRHIPLVFVDGKPEAVEKLRGKVPDAAFTTSSDPKDVIPSKMPHRNPWKTGEPRRGGS